MAFVVTQTCIRCKDTECVDDRPVNAIHAREGQPGDQQDLTPLNAEAARVWKPITDTGESRVKPSWPVDRRLGI